MLQAANGNTFQLTRNGNASGPLRITVQITGNCGVTTLIRDVIVGTPTPSPIEVILIDPYIGRIEMAVDEMPQANTYNWYKNGVMVSGYHSYWAKVPISKTACDVDYGISVEQINNCGTSPQSSRLVYVPCEEFYSVSPNPSSGAFTVAASQTNAVKKSNAVFEEIKVFDLQGNLKKTQLSNKVKTATIDISTLPSGTYYLEVRNGSYKERKQVLLQK